MPGEQDIFNEDRNAAQRVLDGPIFEGFISDRPKSSALPIQSVFG
jgi:hypothetical protein